jgi:endonuclease YncB( thermonuclease family)
MNMRRATVIRVDDGNTLVIRPNMAVKLTGVTPPKRGSLAAAAAKERLESLVLKKKIEFETDTWDRLGRSIARVWVDGVNVNKAMAKFLASIQA